MDKLFAAARRAAVLIVMLLAGACAVDGGTVVPETQRERLAAASIAYTTLVTELGRLADSGALSDAEVDDLKPAVAAGQAALDAAHAAVREDQPITAHLVALQAAIRALQARRDAALAPSIQHPEETP